MKRALKMKMRMFSFLLIYQIKRIYINVAKTEKSKNLSIFGGQKALSMYDLFETPIVKVLRTHSMDTHFEQSFSNNTLPYTRSLSWLVYLF